jgi:hypothetical protein
MQPDPTTRQDAIAWLRVYEDACNRYDIDAAVAMFADDGVLIFEGERIAGQAALRAAHEWDKRAHNQVGFCDYTLDGNSVRCTFVNCHELHRILGIDAIHRPAEVTFNHDHIQTFVLLAADPHDLQRFRQLSALFWDWARAQHPEELAKIGAPGAEGGSALFNLAHAWRDSGNGRNDLATE